VKNYLVYSAIASVMTLAAGVEQEDLLSASHRRNPRKDFVPPSVFQAAGTSAASIQSTVDQFKAALGGINNGNNPGPLTSGRREINWDGGGSTATSPAPTPFEGFLVSRGGLFTTPGTGFVQAPVDGLVTTFGNASYANIFQAFSPVRLFSPVGSNVTDVDFFIPGGTGIQAETTGFGAVFSDVDTPDGRPAFRRGSTVIEFYDSDYRLLYRSDVPPSPGDRSLSFFGAIFPDARIAKVRIIAGDVEPGEDDGRRKDIVVMDDFIYGEPRVGG
jgi:hypothetical protein